MEKLSSTRELEIHRRAKIEGDHAKKKVYSAMGRITTMSALFYFTSQADIALLPSNLAVLLREQQCATPPCIQPTFSCDPTLCGVRGIVIVHRQNDRVQRFPSTAFHIANSTSLIACRVDSFCANLRHLADDAI